jgi:hypothetical protein
MIVVKILKNMTLPLLIFCFILACYINSPVRSLTDSRWVIPTAINIKNHGTTTLDNYRHQIEEQYRYTIIINNGHYYNLFPIGTAICTLPFVMLMGKFISDDSILRNLTFYGRFIASFILALTAVFIYLIARLQLRPPYALVISFIFAFCTSAWSQASRELYQHGPSMLMLTLSLYLILLADRRPWLIQFIGAPLAMAYVIRPTNSLALVVLFLFVFCCHRQYFWRCLGWALMVAAPFVLFNLATYQALLPPYFSPGRLAITSTFFEALLGNLISPARGLLVFSPIFLLIFFGIFLKIRDGQMQSIDYFLLAIIVLHWLAISAYYHWWAGHSYGPRFFADMAPFLVYFLIPVVGYLAGPGRSRKLALTIFVGLAIISFGINLRGACHPQVYDWNSIPVNVDHQPSRIWDWRDLQFLR